MEVLGTSWSLSEDLEIKRCGCLISGTGGKEISLRALAEMYHDVGVNGRVYPCLLCIQICLKEKKENRKLDEYSNVNFSDCVLNSL